MDRKEEYRRHRERILAYAKVYREKNRQHIDNWTKWNRKKLRQEVVTAYGGQCECCGEREWKFLTLDHPNGDGQEDREKYRMQVGQIYAFVKSQGFPKGYYRLLCMNCNWVRRYDTCPHEDARNPDYKEEGPPEYKPKFSRKKKEKSPNIVKPKERFIPTLVPRKVSPSQVEGDSIQDRNRLRMELAKEIERKVNEKHEAKKLEPKITRGSIAAQTYQKDEWVDPI